MKLYDFDNRLNKKQREGVAEATAMREKERELFTAAEQFLRDNPLRFVQKQNAYLLKVAGTWEFMKPASMANRWVLWNDRAFAQVVSLAMEDFGWKYSDVTYTYSETPPDVFNLVSTEGWVKPQPGEPHWFFDVLMQSLGSGKAENIEHLARCIHWKRFHPDAKSSFMMPCILIHGEGGVGKNLLMDAVLFTMFDNQTASATSDHFLGNFNNLVKGKAAILINEQLPDAEQARILRDKLHSERIVVNEKHLPAYYADNTPMVFIGSNNPEGGYLLDRSEADRRVSVMRCDEGLTLLHFISARTKWDRETARTWLFGEGNRIARDPVEIGRWLRVLDARFADQPMPVALHGHDYEALFDVQKRIDDRVIEAVLCDPEFTHIERKVLYNGYLLLLALYSQTKYKVSDIRFNRKVLATIKRLNLPIRLDGVQSTRAVWSNADKATVQRPVRRFIWGNTERTVEWSRDNRESYIGEKNYRDEWIGPDL